MIHSERINVMNVLVAEDDAILRHLLKVLLGRRDIPFRLARNGQEAVAAWEKEKFDLILMDIQMPGMDGLEAARIIREKEKAHAARVPIVAMTAHTTLREKEMCRSAGMDGHIEKPFGFEDLFQLIDRYEA